MNARDARELRRLEAGLTAEAERLQRALRRRDVKLVLAESCTGGLAAATLAARPGISAHLCGSAVTYRSATKSAWLGIPARAIDDRDAVSERTTEAMARTVLRRTPEADLAVAVTGHLGPLPRRHRAREGQLFVALATRGRSGRIIQEFWILPQRNALTPTPKSRRVTAAEAPRKTVLKPDAQVLRKKRQILASHAVLAMVRSVLIGAF